MTQYTIQIVNNSGASKPYVVFMKPAPDQSGGDPVVYNNAWVTFQHITDGGYDGIGYNGPPAFHVAALEAGNPTGEAAAVDFNDRAETVVTLIHAPKGWTAVYS